MLPDFTEDGLLPPGDYPLSIEQLRNSFLVTGKGLNSKTWDVDWRSSLVNNLEKMAKQLWTFDIDRIFIDGSFVERKDHPNDIDGYFECSLRYFASGKLQKDLNLLDPGVWTWSPASLKNSPNSAKRQLPMWLIYRVELYPHYGQITGLTDSHGNELQFPSAFRQRRRDSKPKGIVQLTRSDSK